jgi:hypothetical protein
LPLSPTSPGGLAAEGEPQSRTCRKSGEDFVYLTEGLGLSEEISLDFAATLLPDAAKLLAGLYTLRGGRDATEVDHSLHDGGAILGMPKLANERLVNLDLVDWEEP